MNCLKSWRCGQEAILYIDEDRRDQMDSRSPHIRRHEVCSQAFTLFLDETFAVVMEPIGTASMLSCGL